MNKYYFLQRLYVHKYVSTKNVDLILNNIEYEYEKTYSGQQQIINNNVDTIIYLMPKDHFIGIIRSALVLMNINNECKQKVMSIDFNIINKKNIIEQLIEILPKFKTFFIIVLYSYL